MAFSHVGISAKQSWGSVDPQLLNRPFLHVSLLPLPLPLGCRIGCSLTNLLCSWYSKDKLCLWNTKCVSCMCYFCKNVFLQADLCPTSCRRVWQCQRLLTHHCFARLRATGPFVIAQPYTCSSAHRMSSRNAAASTSAHCLALSILRLFLRLLNCFTPSNFNRIACQFIILNRLRHGPVTIFAVYVRVLNNCDVMVFAATREFTQQPRMLT